MKTRWYFSQPVYSVTTVNCENNNNMNYIVPYKQKFMGGKLSNTLNKGGVNTPKSEINSIQTVRVSLYRPFSIFVSFVPASH